MACTRRTTINNNIRPRAKALVPALIVFACLFVIVARACVGALLVQALAVVYGRGRWPAPALVFALCLCFVPLSSVLRRDSARTGSGVALSLFLPLFLFFWPVAGAGGAGVDQGKAKPLGAWPRGLLYCFVG